MCKVKPIKASEIFPVIEEILEHGGRAWITVTGMSMYPFLRDGLDCVELSACSFDTAKKGDIVLIQRKTGEYVLHRILCKKKSVFYIIGDAQQWIEGPLEKEQLIAVVSAIRRGKRTISCSNFIWKLLSFLWLGVIPIRYKLLKGIRLASQMLHIGKTLKDIRR